MFIETCVPARIEFAIQGIDGPAGEAARRIDFWNLSINNLQPDSLPRISVAVSGSNLRHLGKSNLRRSPCLRIYCAAGLFRIQMSISHGPRF